MIEHQIPGRGSIQLQHLVCDINGTLALEGQRLPGLAAAVPRLKDRPTIHLLTADSYGSAEEIGRCLGLPVQRISDAATPDAKVAYVDSLGAEGVVAISQSANDAGLLAMAPIGIAVLSQEGLSRAALQAADLLVPDIMSALELLERPLRMVASLRR